MWIMCYVRTCVTAYHQIGLELKVRTPPPISIIILTNYILYILMTMVMLAYVMQNCIRT